MDDILGNLQQALGDWARKAGETGWLNAEAVHRIGETEIATPASLFDAPDRPLVIALFGGTGVGKSTLLNRLAQSPVARASAERPTSREITVYVHESVTVARLPDEFPMAQMKTSIHQRAEWRNVMWVDMPDFDSVETSNRILVEQWLPHVDVVLYVVSPERYRDDQGWQLLLEHGRRHAWLFVMNHWDRGEQNQIDDFTQLLLRAGLSEPMIFRTDSGGDLFGEQNREANHATGDDVGADSKHDDFQALETAIRDLAETQFITQLEQRGVVQRVQELQQQGESLREQLGDPARMSALGERWKAHWQQESDTLETSLGWKIPALSQHYAQSEDGFFQRWLPRRPTLSNVLITDKDNASESDTPGGGSAMQRAQETQGSSSHSEGSDLMDNDALTRIESSIERFVQDAATSGALPMRVAQNCVEALMPQLRTKLPTLIRDALNRSLAMPGTALQRGAVKALGLLAALLPLFAMGWIGFRVVNGFVLGGSEPAQYLGTNFAINSALLLALVWGVPALLRHRLKPSLERAAARGLQSGLERVLDEVGHHVTGQLETTESEQQALLNHYQALWATDRPRSGNAAMPDRLRRLLLDSDDTVRANTQS